MPVCWGRPVSTVAVLYYFKCSLLKNNMYIWKEKSMYELLALRRNYTRESPGVEVTTTCTTSLSNELLYVQRGWRVGSWLRQLAALTEDLSFTLSAHVEWLTSAYNSSSREPDALFSAGTCTQMHHVHTHTIRFS